MLLANVRSSRSYNTQVDATAVRAILWGPPRSAPPPRPAEAPGQHARALPVRPRARPWHHPILSRPASSGRSAPASPSVDLYPSLLRVLQVALGLSPVLRPAPQPPGQCQYDRPRPSPKPMSSEANSAAHGPLPAFDPFEQRERWSGVRGSGIALFRASAHEQRGAARPLLHHFPVSFRVAADIPELVRARHSNSRPSRSSSNLALNSLSDSPLIVMTSVTAQPRRAPVTRGASADHSR